MPRHGISPEKGLPSYLLYGEQGATAVAERLHVETIRSRSRLHDWEIKPHRHEVLFQILYMAKGQAMAWMDAAHQPLAGPCAVCVPAMAAHGFRFEPGVQGQVITVQAPHLGMLLAAEPALRARFDLPRHLDLTHAGPAARALAEAVQALVDEYEGHLPWRAAAIDAALVRLMLALGRALPADEASSAAGPGSSRAADHLTRYRALVETRFRLQPRVGELAAELGITPTQLNRLCRAVLGHSALDVLHARTVLEAQRQLAYTTASVKQIGLDLGFADPGYFTRFFQRLAGSTPSAWRERTHLDGTRTRARAEGSSLKRGLPI